MEVPRHLHSRVSATHPLRRHKARPNSSRQLQNARRERRRHAKPAPQVWKGRRSRATDEESGQQHTTCLFRIARRHLQSVKAAAGRNHHNRACPASGQFREGICGRAKPSVPGNTAVPPPNTTIESPIRWNSSNHTPYICPSYTRHTAEQRNSSNGATKGFSWLAFPVAVSF